MPKQFTLRADGWFQAKLPIRIRQCYTSLRRPLDVTFHDQIRLIYLLERARFFPDRDRQRAQAHGPAIEFMNQCFDDAFVPLIESIPVDLEMVSARSASSSVILPSAFTWT